MKIKIHISLRPHSMLTQIGGKIPILFDKTFEVAITPMRLKSLLVGLVAIHDQTFCDCQLGRVGKYDELTNTLEVYANMGSATKAYFEKLKATGWTFNEKAAKGSHSGYVWSESQENKYNEERR